MFRSHGSMVEVYGCTMSLGHTVHQVHCVAVSGVMLGLRLYNETGEYNMYQALCVSVPGVRLGLYNETGTHCARGTLCPRPTP